MGMAWQVYRGGKGSSETEVCRVANGLLAFLSHQGMEELEVEFLLAEK